jgi:hypothetical protein
MMNNRRHSAAPGPRWSCSRQLRRVDQQVGPWFPAIACGVVGGGATPFNGNVALCEDFRILHIVCTVSGTTTINQFANGDAVPGTLKTVTSKAS